MGIQYTEQKVYSTEYISELFLSVNWRAGKYPEKLKRARDNCETVYSAWDDKQLAGLINVLDDGELTAYVHYLCVNPKYQGIGIGKELLKRVKEKYSHYLYLILIAETKELIQYYESQGFDNVNDRYILVIQKETK